MKRTVSLILILAALASLMLPLAGCNRYTHIVISSQQIRDYYCSMYEDDTIEIIKYLGTDSRVLVPAGLKERTVVGISTRAFLECESPVEVYLPGTLTELPSKLFDSCPNLTTIYIPLSVKAIGKNLVSDCPQFKTVLYAGTEAQWKLVSRGNELSDNYALSNAEVVFGFVPEE